VNREDMVIYSGSQNKVYVSQTLYSKLFCQHMEQCPNENPSILHNDTEIGVVEVVDVTEDKNKLDQILSWIHEQIVETNIEYTDIIDKYKLITLDKMKNKRTNIFYQDGLHVSNEIILEIILHTIETLRRITHGYYDFTIQNTDNKEKQIIIFTVHYLPTPTSIQGLNTVLLEIIATEKQVTINPDKNLVKTLKELEQATQELIQKYRKLTKPKKHIDKQHNQPDTNTSTRITRDNVTINMTLTTTPQTQQHNQTNMNHQNTYDKT
jgi:hypothetical protein